MIRFETRAECESDVEQREKERGETDRQRDSDREICTKHKYIGDKIQCLKVIMLLNKFSLVSS